MNAMEMMVAFLNLVALWFVVRRGVDKAVAWWRSTFPIRMRNPDVSVRERQSLPLDTGRLGYGSFGVIDDGSSRSF